ncbi:T9SS type A sorting domain-containing protein [bacterium]|nr:T9SS type A sorting domain-containing protein [bacterium]
MKVDLIDVRKYSPQTTVDSFILMGWGNWATPSVWYGQKIYWDDIRLTGYADYDVGVKGILSGDSVWKSTAYTPTARIKNFGRKVADSFLVIGQIEGGSGVVYADTLTWSLTADTEDTVSFKEFKPSDAANYTLTVSTVMTPDESDEDDVMSKTLYGSGIEEQPIPQALNLDVISLQVGEGVLRVSYSLPLGEQGTISLYDPTGRRSENLRVKGEGKVSFKSGLASGVYFIRLETEKMSVTKKTLLLR